MSDFEKRVVSLPSNTNEYDNSEINWSFFSIFGNIIENLNGGTSYDWKSVA